MKAIIPLIYALTLAGCVSVSPDSTVTPFSAPPVGKPATEEAVVTPPPLPAPLTALSEWEIAAAYEDVLGRRPSREESWTWRDQSLREPFTKDDLRRALNASEERRRLVPENVIRRAFREFHGIEPNAEAMRFYRRRLIDDGWSVGKVRTAIARAHVDESNRGESSRGRGDDKRRDDQSHSRRANDEFDAIITRAYDDLLERKPDPDGRSHYRQLLERGETEAGIRARIKESVEYRVTLPDAKTARAYRDILGRDPDQSGLQSYRKKIVDKGWTEEDVKNDLRKSAEYKSKNR